ncbi:hypothetical protein BCR34DRAFT_596755 [Clohesyomyces aquaticus]|uniref:F-box domain-containing protein n=1 Tax=Clohesyomyces aquaticus TaxID=1231657 RepID=A0A1Y2A4Y0_9PLEO|nr:hypothetical protein BCR34DRAFT_596755 [Clohesyomyces aquaticus]
MLDGHDIWGIKELDRLAPSTIKISKLNLLGCLLDQGSLRKLVQACRDLRSLKYSQIDNDVHDLDTGLRQDDGYHACQEALLTPSTFITVIEACKSTLENLEIDLKGIYGQFQDSSHKFHGLHEFTRSQSLNIEVRHLRTFQDLPPSLERLKLRFWLWSSSQPEFSQPDFLGFLPRPDRTRWPQMKTVCLEGGYDKACWEKDERMKQLISIGAWIHDSGTGPCCSACRAGNVSFSLTNTALHRVHSGRRQWNIFDDEVEE